MTLVPIHGDIYAFATDLLDEGIEPALDRMLGPEGMRGVTVAATYHVSRDVFPHNPRRTVSYVDAGCYFRPDQTRYLASGIRPTQHEVCEHVDPLAAFRTATRARGAELNAWLVCLHDVPAGMARDDIVQHNMFGDPMRTELCPANPQVRAYVTAMVGDLARYEPDSVVLESLHYHAFQHGYHHERCLVDLDPLTEFLLGLCFCSHCTNRAASSGVDVDRLHKWCVETTRQIMNGEAVPTVPNELPTRAEVARLANGEMGGYLRMREETVHTLVEESAIALGGTSRLCFQDPSGGKGWATGDPPDGPGIDDGWQLGIDAGRISAAVDEYRIVCFASEPSRLELEVRTARTRIGKTPMSCVLRPSPPDNYGVDDICEKLDVLARLGVQKIGFYHYGLQPLSRLADLAEALRISAQRGVT